MSLFVTIYAGRTADEVVSFWTDAAESVLATISGGDKIRIKVGRPGATPVLDIVSGTPLAGGSNVTLANPCTVRFHQDDTRTLTPGIYEIEAAVVDSTDSGVIKHAVSGVFNLLESQAGGVT